MVQISFADLYTSEAERVLRARARPDGALGELLVAQAQRAGLEGGFELTCAALDELMLRFARARAVTVAARGAGWFEARDASGVWTTWVGGPAPLDASCSCPDFRTAALGACAHVLAVLAQAPGRASRNAAPAARWQPLRPLTGAGAWRERAWVDAAVAGAEHLPAGPALVDHLVTADPAPRSIEPALAALIEGERARRGRAGLVSEAALSGALATLRAPLFPYQREGVRRFFSAGRLLLADDMGLGKTAQAIAIAHVLIAVGLVRHGLVVVPASLRLPWAAEWRRFSDVQPVIVEGSAARRRAQYARGTGILIASYEQMRRDARVLSGLGLDLVVLDEAQRIKNAESQTARAVKQLEAPWRLALSGTPLENRLDDVVSIMEWVDELALAPRWRIAGRHASGAGARDLATVHARLEPCMVRRTRGEVLCDLPARRDITIPVPLTGPQREAHHQLAPAIAEIAQRMQRRTRRREDVVRLHKLLTQQRLICNGLALYRFADWWPGLRRRPPGDDPAVDLASPKLGVVQALLESLVIDQGRRVVVFSQWRRMLELAAWACGPLLARVGRRGEYFSGSETPARRTENVARFHDDPAVAVLWATDAGGVGLNLQRAASCCIQLELPWNPATVEQRVGRIHRMGQGEPVEVYCLVADDGIEGRIANKLHDKRALFEGVFEGTRDEVPAGVPDRERMLSLVTDERRWN